MIDDLSVLTSANFFVIKKKLTDKAIDDMFVSLRARHGVKSSNNFKHTREDVGNTKCSAISFMYKAPPAFLENSTKIREELCGYLLIVEYQKHAAIFASRLSLPAPFKTQHLGAVPNAKIEGAIATADAIFQRMKVRNMSISPYAMRSKTVEAQDLANVMGPAGSSRYAPGTYMVLANGHRSTATPSTGRIGVQSSRVGFDQIVEFAVGVIDALRANATNVSPFIRSFARPVTLEEALGESQPASMAIDTSMLIDAIDGPEMSVRLVRDDNNPVELTAAELEVLIQQLDQPLVIEGNDKLRQAKVPGSDVVAATLRLNSSRIALRSLQLPPASDVFVESLEKPVGGDDDRVSLREYLDRANAFIVLFDDVRLAYINGHVFRDETLMDGGTAFLRYFNPEPTLAAVTCEKGKFVAGQTAFDATSTFGVIVNTIAANDPILLCDDLGDEWADFIGVKEEGGVTQISFYHAKHGPLSTSAGSFHVAVSQALKNLGNMGFPEERMAYKTQFWSNLYNAPRQPTQISRTIRSNAQNLGATLADTRTAPDARRRAIIVTSSISKQQVTDVFAAIHNGQRPAPSFVQLYWLLQTFFSACTEVGATGSIICQP